MGQDVREQRQNYVGIDGERTDASQRPLRPADKHNQVAPKVHLGGRSDSSDL